MKKIIIGIIVAITAILFWSPWMGEGGGEDVIQKVQQKESVKAEMEELTSKYGYQATLSYNTHFEVPLPSVATPMFGADVALRTKIIPVPNIAKCGTLKYIFTF